MRRSTPQPIGDVVKDVVERLSQTKKKDPAKILSLWPRVCGKELARHSRPKGLRGTTLQVFVDESAWLYQASLQKERMLVALQKKIGREKIQKIVFRIGDIR
jgi:predicted nucleic acid-binding Zn ribbon protein